MDHARSLIVALVLLLAAASTGIAQQTTFTPNCSGTASSDTAAFESIKTTVGTTNPATIQIPYKLNPAQKCKVNNLTVTSNITLVGTNGSGIHVVTGQSLTVQGPIVADAKPLFLNATAGLGTVSILARAVQEVYPEWWGASPSASAAVNTPALQAAIIGAYGNTRTNGSGNWIYNRILKFSGMYDINDELNVYHMIGFRWEGQNKFNSGIRQTATNKRIINGQSVAYGLFYNIHFQTSVSQNTALIDLDYDGSQGSDLRPQNITFQDCVIQGSSVGYIGVRIAKSGGGAQGDNIRFYNCYINGFLEAGAQLGLDSSTRATNAINVLWHGGDIQGCPKYGLAAYGGNWIVEGGWTFENASGGSFTQTGFDVYHFGPESPAAIRDGRTESWKLSSGVAAIENVSVNPNGVITWYDSNSGGSVAGSTVAANYALTGTTIGGDGKVYKVTTGGTFGGLGITSVASAGASSLTVAGTPWTVNAFTGYKVSIIDGTGEPSQLFGSYKAGATSQSILISSNTNNTLTLASPWTTAPDATSRFVIEPDWGTQTTSGSVVFELYDYNVVEGAETIANSKLVGGKITVNSSHTSIHWLFTSRTDALPFMYDGRNPYGEISNVFVLGSPQNGAAPLLVKTWYAPSSGGDLGGNLLKDYTQRNLGAQKIVWSQALVSDPNSRFADVWVGRGDGIRGDDASSTTRNVLGIGGTLGKLTPAGTDQAGSALVLQGGLSTGSGASGPINFRIGSIGSTGTTVNDGVVVGGIGSNRLTWQYKGADVASDAAIVPTGNLFHVTGTTTITSITSTGITAGTEITIIFDGILTFTDGSNLVLAGDFVTTANDTITLKFDGVSWFETSRSVN